MLHRLSVYLFARLQQTRCDEPTCRRLLHTARALLPALPHVLQLADHWCGAGFWTALKLQRWRIHCGCVVTPETEVVICAAVDAVESRYHALSISQRQEKINILRAKICGDVIATVWQKDLVIHCLASLEASPDDFCALVRAARLLQGRTWHDMMTDGEFTKEDLVKFERGLPVVSAQKLSAQARKYRIDEAQLAGAYARLHGAHIPWRQLHIAQPDYFISSTDRDLLAQLARDSPSSGEWLLHQRLCKGLSQHEQSTTAPWHTLNSRYGALESNTNYPEWNHVLKIPAASRDEFLRLILWTWHPTLRDTVRGYPHFIHPRLTTEPIYLQPEDATLPQVVTQWAHQPGTLGEALIWARLRPTPQSRGAIVHSMRTRFHRTDISEQYITLLERNYLSLTPKKSPQKIPAAATTIHQLAAVLDIDPDILLTAAAHTSLPTTNVSWTMKYIHTDGKVAWDKIPLYPKLSILRTLAAIDGCSVSDAAARLNPRLHPTLAIEKLPSYPGHAVPIEADDALRMRLYALIGHRTIGERLTFWRLAAPRHWTVEESAAALGVRRARLSRFERREWLPNADELARIATICRWDFAELMHMRATEPTQTWPCTATMPKTRAP